MPSTPRTEALTALTAKVFGVGLARTGTTSMHRAMGLLGLNSAPDSIALLDSMDIDFLASHDAFFDNPIPFRYRELDAVCPDARWIVTQRPLKEWLASMQWLFGPGLDRLDPATRAVGDHMHRELYGSDKFDPHRLSTIYERHYADLADWITGRNAIWIHVDRGIVWEPICELLNVDVPVEPFPHTNKRRRTWRRQLP